MIFIMVYNIFKIENQVIVKMMIILPQNSLLTASYNLIQATVQLLYLIKKEKIKKSRRLTI